MALILGFDIGTGALAESWNKLAHSTAGPAPALPLSPAEVQQIVSRPPQQQAEALMRAALNRDSRAVDLINGRLDQWHGQLQNTSTWSDLDLAARNSDDLRVRAAAIEIDLISFNLAKDDVTAERLHDAGESNPALRPANAFALGMLANRGVAPGKIRDWLLQWAKDPDPNTRLWAVEGLAQIGTNETLHDLVSIFQTDPFPQVRERAACNLARTGMLTREQRMGAVPQLLQIAEENQDSSTRAWAFEALRQITSQPLPNQIAPWRRWYARSSDLKPQKIRAAARWELSGGN